MRTPKNPLLCALAIVVLTASACSDSTAPSAPPKLGLRAGTVASADGIATVEVPAGALSENIAITVTPATKPTPNSLMVIATAYDLGPNGTQFAKPLTLTIKYDPAKVPADGGVESLALYHLVNDTWQQVTGSAVDTVAHTIHGSITSFSIYSIQATSAITQSLAAGENFTCALNHRGAAFCWGEGTAGELGDGVLTSSSTPVAVAGGLTFRAISADGETVCGLLDDGSAECWGRAPGTLGATSHQSAQPTAVPGDVHFSSLSVGLTSACGIATTGGAYCWGANDHEQLGLGTSTAQLDTTLHLTPAAVTGGSQFVMVSTGVFGACALDGSGIASCWGDNGFGALGIGQVDSTLLSHPVNVSGGLVFQSISSGALYACGIVTSGTTECWGNNTSGQLGDGTVTSRFAPTAISGSPSFASVFSGAHNDILQSTCALDASGTASCWGQNDNGQLGAPSSDICNFDGAVPCSVAPLAVQGGLTFSTVAMGLLHSCAMTADRIVYCWGANELGQLGDGNTTSSTTPELSSFSPVVIAASRVIRTPVVAKRVARRSLRVRLVPAAP